MSLLHRIHKDHSHHGADPAKPFPTDSQPIGQQQPNSRFARRRSSGLKLFAQPTTPNPTSSKEAHKAWEADYLKDLRANRPARPGGSRPIPERAATSTPDPYPRAASAMSFRPSVPRGYTDFGIETSQERCASALSHRRADASMGGIQGSKLHGGRPLVRSPNAGRPSRDVSAATMISEDLAAIQSGVYRENGMRCLERQEARSLREALEGMDLREEEKVHTAAQDEASALIWDHRNQGRTDMDPYRPFDYEQHTEKGACTHDGSMGKDLQQNAATSNNQRSASDSSTSNSASSRQISSNRSRKTSVTFQEPEVMSRDTDTNDTQIPASCDAPQKKSYMGLASSKLPTISRTRRRSSGPRARNVSGGLFRNPDDKIYEEPDLKDPAVAPEQSRIPAPLASKARNVVSNPSSMGPINAHPRVTSAEDKPRAYRSEIHRNPPSKSRDPFYTNNQSYSESNGWSHAPDNDPGSVRPPTRDGKEIRSDDIRAATSMRMKDRSPKLPSPTVVSHRPGRPIVSFEQDWKPKESDNDHETSPTRPSGVPPRLRPKPRMPASTASAPIIPTINAPEPPSIQIDDVPSKEPPPISSISVSETPIPTISVAEDEPPPKRPLPSPSNKPRPTPAQRPLPHHYSTTPVHSSKLHWSPSSRRATAQCAQCALPIEGRIVSAASQRFHPHCFICHHCSEPLECVAFYPEPDSARDARLTRIENRASGSLTEEAENPNQTAFDDGDPSPRFYCHLDFHELFSPRCRSCKTPIESEVVLACGASWHVGHFFCAQCGDPFDKQTPFVEKDGYAWCVGCHAGRFNGKCKGCRRVILEEGVQALGGEWHAGCFCCVECGGPFEDGRFFTRNGDEKPVCVRCEERRLKA